MCSKLCFAPKLGISAFSVGICLAKSLTCSISGTTRDTGMVSKDHL